MSAHVVSKTHIDLMVRAAERYGRGELQGSKFRWWRVDDNGDYAGWRELDRYAEELPSYEDWLEKVTPSMLGQLLVAENVRSVSYRYPDDDADVGELPGPIDAYYVGPYVYREPARVLTPGEVFAAIDYYDYQSCETPDWRKSEAFAFCEALRNAACRRVDGYGEAPWGFEDGYMGHGRRSVSDRDVR